MQLPNHFPRHTNSPRLSSVAYVARTHRPLTLFFFFNDTPTTEIYTLSLHDALPIYRREKVTYLGQNDVGLLERGEVATTVEARVAMNVVDTLEPRTRRQKRFGWERDDSGGDRKSTRLNSSHSSISYAVFCLKKKKI